MAIMKTKVVFNDIIPFRGFLAMCLWPFIFVRNSAVSHYNTAVNNHEQIHAQQQKEMLILPFLIWYSIEWLCRLAQYRNSNKAYRNISFEREAYANEKDLTYLGSRKPYAWTEYLRIK